MNLKIIQGRGPDFPLMYMFFFLKPLHLTDLDCSLVDISVHASSSIPSHPPTSYIHYHFRCIPWQPYEGKTLGKNHDAALYWLQIADFSNHGNYHREVWAAKQPKHTYIQRVAWKKSGGPKALHFTTYPSIDEFTFPLRILFRGIRTFGLFHHDTSYTTTEIHMKMSSILTEHPLLPSAMMLCHAYDAEKRRSLM